MNGTRGRVLFPFLVAGAAVACQPATTQATLITFGFSGVVDTVLGDMSSFDGSIIVGTPFEGSYVFDSTTADVDSQWWTGDYRDAITSYNVTVGSYTLNGPTASAYNGIYVKAGLGEAEYVAQAGSVIEGHSVDLIVAVNDLDGTALSDTALPLVPPSLDPFEEQGFLIAEEHLLFRLGGSLTDFWLIPEPGTAGLLLFGAAMVAARRRG